MTIAPPTNDMFRLRTNDFGALFTIFATPLPIAARILLLFCLSAKAGAESQGVFSHAATMAIMLVIMAATGVGLTVVFLIARNRRRYIHLCYIATIVYTLLITGLSACIIPLLLACFPSYIAGYPPSMQLLFPIFVFANLQFLFHNQILSGLQCFTHYFWMNVLQSMSLLIGVFVLALADYWTVASAFSVWTLSLLFPLPFQKVAILRRSEGTSIQNHRLAKLLPLLIAHAAKSSVATISDALVFRSGVLVLRVFAPFSVVGVYAIACSISEVILNLPKGLGVFLLPRLTATRGQVTQQVLWRYAISFFLLAFLAGLMVLVTPAISIVLNQEEYTESIRLSRILLVGTTFMGWGMLIASFMRASGDMKAVMNASLLSLVVVAISSFSLIPIFHAYGASLAAILGFSTYALYTAKWLHTAFSKSLKDSYRSIAVLSQG